ncbi:MAG: MAPEG family protein [Proteobacteria bacterium]|nr:MAPEG family protein [Pseudomonadota bacterium]
MNETSITLIAYIAWIIVLILTIISIRSYWVLSGQRAANSFSVNGLDVSPFMERLSRVHANCFENFPIFGGLLLLALLLDMSYITNPLAYAFLGLRIAQGIVHLISKNVFFVYLRLTLFLAQLVIAIYWTYLFLK